MMSRAEVTSLFSALAYLSKHLTHGMQLFQKTNFKGLFSQRCDSQPRTQHLNVRRAAELGRELRRGWNVLLVSSSSCALPYCL